MDTSRRHFLKQVGRLATGGLLLQTLPLKAASRSVLVQRAFYTMGTVVTVSAYGESAAHAHQAITKIQCEFQRLDNLLSVYKPDSAVSRINRSAGKQMIAVETDVQAILQQAQNFYKKTNGAFNIGIEPLMRLWGFRQNNRSIDHVPGDREIARALEAISPKFVVTDNNTAGLLNEHSAIDLGGIAVGYSVDRAAAILKSEGIETALINHSGDIYALGAPPDQDGWIIGIPDPQRPNEIIANFSVKDQAVSTSGNYENFVSCQEKHFGHIINPHTGFPSDRLLSFTAICDTAIEADAYSTGCFCSEKLPAAMSAIMVNRNSEIRVSGNINLF